MRNGYSQPLFELKTAWVEDNIDRLNIKAVLCTGDLVQRNDCDQVDEKVNQTSRQMWNMVSRCFSRLDGKVPYIISCGNKDYGYIDSECGNSNFPKYFPSDRNSCWKDCLVETYRNRQNKRSLENAAYEFQLGAWGKWLIVATEFAPRDEVLDWVSGLITSDKYKGHNVILLTHDFMRQYGVRTDNEKYQLSPRNWGQQVWDKLVSPSSNIRLVVCGHSGGPGKWEDGVAYRMDHNIHGGKVHQMMFNVQFLGGGRQGNGGDGWLRILEFLPDGKTLKVRTYSPLFGISPTTRHLAERTDSCDRFDIVFD